MSTFSHFATDALHVGQEPEQWAHHEVVPPICLATTFKQPAPGEPKSFDYSRAGNATRVSLELCIASLEAAKHCSTYSSGLAASAAVVSLLTVGDTVLACNDMYGGTVRFLNRIVSRAGIKCVRAILSAENIGKFIEEHGIKLVWIESPSNPLLRITDIAAVCSEVKKFPGVYTVVDNTFMSPYFQRPLDLGADMVIHSITKYINGHSDVVMGCVCTNDKQIAEHLEFQQLAVGAVPSAFDCFLVNRGIKTLHIRMQRHYENGLAVAKFLEKHPLVTKVLYPALPSHPEYEIHQKQTKGMSGMVSFYIKGDLEASKTFLKSLQIFALAESLGGYESLAEHPALMTHASVSKESRDELGISDNLLRLSVGLEDIEDLIADLDQALQASQRKI
ncbi:putative cystathionine gamma-lyase 2 [Trichinella spiralis]|uniref:cystathionine gamma-lyase n=1 Tax=Trichinella spiralis TaxID=6334 RepID=A0A0V1BN36_TRISP|nr:putative cystathionine gamma-lyase 2 [Trichinella spiralis]KRY38433.1 putative cystathionine gamma-lyase 2 [Trichinella spiralis]